MFAAREGATTMVFSIKRQAAEAALFRLRAIEEKFPDSADDTSPSSPYVIGTHARSLHGEGDGLTLL